MSHKTTSLQTLMHLVKGYIGTGILAMPKAFFDAGLLIGSIGTPIIGMICNYSIHLLINTNDYICEKLNLPPLDYAEVGEKALLVGPKKLRPYAKICGFLVALFLLLTQFGECCAYNLFIADNLRKFSMNLNLFSFANMSVEFYLLFLLPIMIVLNFVKSIKHLSIGSTCANLIQLTGLIIICYNLLLGIPSVSTRPAVGNNLALFFSTTVFTFEGISVTLPIYKAMKHPKSFGKTFGVVNIAIVIVVLLYFTIGFLGYLKYGEDVAPSITLSLPQEPLYECVRMMYAIAITLTYPLQLYVPIQMLWPNIKAKLENAKKSDFTICVADYLFRASLVTFTFGLSAIIPRLDLVIALVGAISCSMITIIIPPILHTIVFWEEKTDTLSKVWLGSRNIFVCSVGVVGFATGTYFSIQAIVNAFQEGLTED